MSLSVQDARIEVFDPDNSSFDNPDFTIPKKDIANVSASRRITKRKDSATLEIHNDNGQYTTGLENNIRSGQRILFIASLEPDITYWGEGEWGDGPWAGESTRWTGIIRDITFTYAGPNKSYIKLKAEDFVFGLMSKRLLFDTFTDKPIAGSSDSILNKALKQEVPEIDRSEIEDFTSQNTSVSSDGDDLLEFSISMAERANAIMRSKKDKLHFDDVSEKSPEFDLDYTDIGYFNLTEDDASMANEVRVDGGQDTRVDDEQTTQDGYVTATSSNRVKFQVSTRKSSIAKLELWTKRTSSEENITVRIQKDDGGSPVAPSDKTSDIANKTLSEEFIAQDGYTTFIMPDHTLPEPNPWIIVQSDGDTGQDIGVRTSDNKPTYKAKYSFTITVRESNRSSVDKYRKREARIKSESITSSKDARDIAEAHIDHYSVPEKQLEMPAESQRSHYLDVGEVVTADFPRERVDGEYIITEKDESYQGNKLQIDFSAKEVDSI